MRTILSGRQGAILDGYVRVAELVKYTVTVDENKFYTGEWNLDAECRILDRFRQKHASSFDLVLEFNPDNGKRFKYKWKHIAVIFAENGRSLTISGAGKPDILS